MINIIELVNLLNQVNIPLAYSHFEITESSPAPSPPFMVYLEEDSTNFGADNKVWSKLLNYSIEVYTDYKDLELEKKIEDILDSNNIYYETTEVYIQQQNLYQRVYSITITK